MSDEKPPRDHDWVGAADVLVGAALTSFGLYPVFGAHAYALVLGMLFLGPHVAGTYRRKR